MNSKFELKSASPEIPIKWLEILVLHLLPGVIIVLAYALVVPIVSNAGYPKIVALGLTALGVLVPVQLGFIYLQGKKTTGRYSLTEVLGFGEKLKVKEYVGYSLALFLWAGFVFTVLAPVNDFLLTRFFSWVPDWFILVEDLSTFSRPALIVAFLSTFFVTGIIAPAVEEIYFRGYLLPRMSWLGGSAVLVHTVLFIVYHFWSPWQLITRVIAIYPLVYMVKKKKSLYLGIFAHCLLNIVGDALFMIPLLLR